ncbi:glycoside hydrolase family 31 protein [Scatolibacter rhodanostii]|uniref:glycoside hydrolase family 31 protein n=1 Tax=Scatolibacter rhodanostii TaxID=2014781 RepID=UPI000C071608|nr:TIM-barrel domain-containing protein [Scatolibacter rhodanostii]
MAILKQQQNKLVIISNNEKVWIEAWGKDSLRIRSTKQPSMPLENWALEEKVESESKITIHESGAVIQNGKIQAQVSKSGKITYLNSQGKVLLEEFVRNRSDFHSPKCSALDLDAREHRPILGGDFSTTVRFESDPQEKLFGMGQYQQTIYNLKGCELELAHRNSQASVPFVLSSLGYGFLWNNPAIGNVTFGTNVTSWRSISTKVIDYWITAGDTPAEIEENYASVTGTVPMMPDYAMGFWQCKLRYQTQEELLSVAREYKKRNLPISVIVIDFFHWPLEGEWKFDLEYWPDPDAMVAELKEMGIELMVSVWPTVDYQSENFKEMREKGLLINCDRGFPNGLRMLNDSLHYDATNPEARNFLWAKIKQNYYDKGIKVFWLDEAEPEYSFYDFDNYRYHLGPNVQIGNIYPKCYAQTFYEGMEQEGQKNILNLLRCAWAGSQKYGALVWSGDIHSSFKSMQNQFAAGLHMGIAGIPWWTTDIGGFHGGDPSDPAFREVFVRWFQYGAFCPVMRLHGDREPHSKPMSTVGGGRCPSGGPNEVWSYGEKVYGVCKQYMTIRENLKPYITDCMQQAHEKGTPVMSPLFYGFPEDKECWEDTKSYLFGSSLLVAPVLSAGMTARKVYLPAGKQWIDVWTRQKYEGGQRIEVDSPLETIPVFTCEEKLIQCFDTSDK